MNTRKIESLLWAILGVLLWMLADVGADSIFHQGYARWHHDVFTWVGTIAWCWACMRRSS